MTKDEQITKLQADFAVARQRTNVEKEKSRILGNMTDGLRSQLADRHKLCVDFETKWHAERQRREQAEAESKKLASWMADSSVKCHSCEELRQQLLSAQAAIADALTCVPDDFEAFKILSKVDLSLLRQHDAEVRKPLVDALKLLQTRVETRGCQMIIERALAKDGSK